MFAKIFSQIYDGTLGGDWMALVTFQQMLVLSDEEGVVDMTPAAIHRVTGIPLDIIEHGVAKLAEPDPHSRSNSHEGRRIISIDPDRSWGWIVVNKRYYRDLANREDKRRKDRERIADKRKNTSKSDTSPNVSECRKESQKVADVAHTDTDTDTDTTTPLSGSSPTTRIQATQVLQELNRRTLRPPARPFEPVESNLRFIRQRLAESGFQTVMDVTTRKILHWWNTDMQEYLRPATLYNAQKFAQYVGELGTPLRRKDGKKPKEVFTAEHLLLVTETVTVP